MPDTIVNSFLVRFVQEQSPAPGQLSGAWHGIIRHVQSSKEKRFTNIGDAIAFMNNYVEITPERERHDDRG